MAHLWGLVENLPDVTQDAANGLTDGGFSEAAAAGGTPADGPRLTRVSAALSLRPIDILHTLFLRRHLLAVAFVVPILATTFLWSSKYTAESVLMVMLNRESGAAADPSGLGPSVVAVEALKVIRGEIAILQSPATIRLAVERLRPDGVAQPKPLETFMSGLAARLKGVVGQSAPALEPSRDIYVEQIQKSLKADTDTNTNIIRIGYDSPDRATAIATVEAVVDAYVERRRQVFSASVSRILTTRIEEYQAQLSATETEIQRVRTVFGVLDFGQEQQLSTVRRDAIEQRLANVSEMLAVNKAQLAEARALLTSQPAAIQAETATSNAAPNDDTRNLLARLIQERRHLQEAYAANYPPLQDLNLRIATAQQSLQDNARASYATTRSVRNPQVELLSQRVVQLGLDTSALTQQQMELMGQRKELVDRMAELRNAEVQIRPLEQRRMSLESIIQQLSTREAGNQVGEEAGGPRNPSVRVLQEAEAPRSATGNKRVLLIGGVLGGALLVGALTFLLTVLRRVFLTADEAQRHLGVPVVGTFRQFLTVSDKGDGAAARRANAAALADLAAMLIDQCQAGSKRTPTAAGRTRSATALGVVQLMAGGSDDDRDQLGRGLAAELLRCGRGPVVLLDLEHGSAPLLRAIGVDAHARPQLIGETSLRATTISGLLVGDDMPMSPLVDPQRSQDDVRRELAALTAAFPTVLLLGPDDALGYAALRLAGLVDANVLVIRASQSKRAWLADIVGHLDESGGRLLGFAFTDQRAIFPKRLVGWL